MNWAYSDPLLKDAAKQIIKHTIASASFLQRKLSIGYARAASILDLLESQGIISPSKGAIPRDVLITDISKIKDLIQPKKLSDQELQEKVQELDMKVHKIIYALNLMSNEVPGNDDEDNDPLFAEAIKFAEKKGGKLTARDVQEKFKIGYARSARIVDELVDEGLLDEG